MIFTLESENDFYAYKGFVLSKFCLYNGGIYHIEMKCLVKIYEFIFQHVVYMHTIDFLYEFLIYRVWHV